MLKISDRILASVLCFTFIVLLTNCTSANSHIEDFYISDVLKKASIDTTIVMLGHPEIIHSEFGDAVSFNGIDDGIILDLMPLDGLNSFTIEAVIKPSSGGNFEQRFLHIGEINGPRVLMELRSTPEHWYFDAFIKNDSANKALIDSTLQHPLDTWYHVAYVSDNGSLKTYIDGQSELSGHIEMVPLKTGQMSVGVRLNKVSWFRGSIYRIRISPSALSPEKFLNMKN